MASTEYNRGTSFTDAQAAAPSAPLSGPGVDAEFDRVKIALDSTQQNLALIQRDDGALANGSVGAEQIQPEVYTGLSPVSKWTAGVSYKVNQTTFFDNGTALKLYRCLIAHVGTIFSNDLAAGRWLEIANYTPPATVGTVSIASGGTGATDAAGARANLGLGTLATQNTVPVTQGGTGATDAAGARTALNAQQADATLAGLAALAPGANEAIYATGTDAFGVYPTTTFSRNLMGAGSAASFVAGLGIASQAEAQAGTDNTKLMTPATSTARWAYATPQTAAGNSNTFSGIPGGISEVEIGFQGISYSGATQAQLLVRIGPSAGVETTNYNAVSTSSETVGTVSDATCFPVILDLQANAAYGEMQLHLMDVATNLWTSRHSVKLGTNKIANGGGSKAIAGALSVLSFIVSNGAFSFDAGTFYVRYR